MSLSARLQPGNTLAAKSTAHRAFCRFLSDEGMALEEVFALVDQLDEGRGLTVVMDKFAIYLAFGDGQRGSKLATNTVNGYFGHVKQWLISLYPSLRATIQPELQVVGTRLSKYCKKRNGGVMVKKAPACRKEDLALLLQAIYKYATSSSEYLDGLLINWLWFLFGRSSDLCGLQADNIAVYPGGALCVRFTRQKTADESGLALFRDRESFITCPVHALAVALVMKTGKERRVFSQLPAVAESTDEDRDLLSIPLRDLLNEQRTTGGRAPLAAPPLARVAGVQSPAVHGYVNRLLAPIQKTQVGRVVSTEISSHSFRRGGAQHANGDASLSPQWILDRGSWNMTATNKGFAYVVNTTREDQQVAKCLSGWRVDSTIAHNDLSAFEGVVSTKIQRLDAVLFSGCDGLDPHVVDVLMATVILNYPSMIQLQANHDVGFIARLRECMKYVNVGEPELLAWNCFLGAHDASAVEQQSQKCVKLPTRRLDERVQESDLAGLSRLVGSRDKPASDRTEELFSQLLQSNRLLGERVLLLERLLESNGIVSKLATAGNETGREGNGSVAGGRTVQGQLRCPATTPVKIRKAARKSLRDVWVEWRSVLPPRWGPQSPLTRQERHEYKFAVACMTLFLTEGYRIDSRSPNFSSDVQRYGDLAEQRLISYLRNANISANALGTIVKAMREMYSHGVLNELIAAHAKLVRNERVFDDLPAGYETVCVLPLAPIRPLHPTPEQ